jgi:hypothetical protein
MINNLMLIYMVDLVNLVQVFVNSFQNLNFSIIKLISDIVVK